MLYVGESTERVLREIGIEKIGDLANYADLRLLGDTLGISVRSLLASAQGKSSNLVDPEQNQAKGMSSSETLIRDTNDYQELREVLVRNANIIAQRLLRDQLVGNAVSVQIKRNDFASFSKVKKVQKGVSTLPQILSETIPLLEKLLNNHPELIRLLGVGVSGLRKKTNYLEQPQLVDIESQLSNKDHGQEVIKKINESLNEKVLFKAIELE
ncbi:unnamed protein product [Didymodactylos carnosus]|uniref:DNA polymerase Y-family little finger domain-containing protein n=1 Tax=Didymodactylos carnosus TaxID=1234261 RepID=A0A8S2WES2_9BILA|nr:unnamed protein product [Didymodactylos carnosus]CAF4447596.1 unnamed protein product [Didymodactylos carnosus]